jgi:hypothetical protein
VRRSNGSRRVRPSERGEARGVGELALRCGGRDAKCLSEPVVVREDPGDQWYCDGELLLHRLVRAFSSASGYVEFGDPVNTRLSRRETTRDLQRFARESGFNRSSSASMSLFNVHLDNLRRFQLCDVQYPNEELGELVSDIELSDVDLGLSFSAATQSTVSITALGRALVAACTPPTTPDASEQRVQKPMSRRREAKSSCANRRQRLPKQRSGT